MQTTTGVSHSTRPPQRRSGDELPIKEAIAWSGDSGVGPHRIATADGTLQIAGLNSGGDCCGYGDVDQHVRVASNKLQGVD